MLRSVGCYGSMLFLLFCLTSNIDAQTLPVLRTCDGRPCQMIPLNIPGECIQEEKFRIVGPRTCYDCAYVKPDCDTSANATEREYVPPCPGLVCPQLPTVPDSCIMKGPIQWQRSGVRCRACPGVNPFCLDLNLVICAEEAANCPGVPHGTALACIDQTVRGTTEPCLSCPKLKPECKSSVSKVPMCTECPKLPNIPARCIRLGALQRSQTDTVCRECPIPDPYCPGLNLQLCDASSCTPLPRRIARSCIIQTVSEVANHACLTCPAIRAQCRPRVEIIPPCLDNVCLRIPVNYPVKCIMDGLLRLSGNRVCRGCPFANPVCPGVSLRVCQRYVGCRGVPPNTARECIDQNVLDDAAEGPCLSCPTLKRECLLSPGGLKPCPNQVCMSVIGVPPECILEGPVISDRCLGCPRVDPFCPSLTLEVCPLHRPKCNPPPANTLPSCLDVTVLDENGLCTTCPKLKPICIREVQPPIGDGMKQCPDNKCVPLTGIPPHCVKNAPVKTLSDGTKCLPCPIIDPFCQGLNLPICQNHLMDCFGVPKNTALECINQRVIFFQRPCLTCPSLKPECLPPVDKDGLRPCVTNECINLPGIPSQCYKEGPRIILSSGLECRGCPVFDPFCEILNLPVCPSHLPCTQLPVDVRLECKTAELFQEGPLQCLSCPKIKDHPSCVPNPPPPPPPTLPVDPPVVGPPIGILPIGDQPPLDPAFVDPSVIDPSVVDPPVQQPPRGVIPNCEELTCLPTIGVPANCLTVAPIIYRADGTRCMGCQRVLPTCQALQMVLCPMYVGTCVPLQKGTRPECIEQRVEYENAHCLTCPVLKPECYNKELQVCPHLQCEGLPPEQSDECIEQKVIDYEGIKCYTCPKLIAGCKNNPLADNPLLSGG